MSKVLLAGFLVGVAMSASASAMAQTSGDPPRYAFTLTPQDVAVVEAALLKAPVAGETWLPTYAKIEQQKATFIQQEQAAQKAPAPKTPQQSDSKK